MTFNNVGDFPKKKLSPTFKILAHYIIMCNKSYISLT